MNGTRLLKMGFCVLLGALVFVLSQANAMAQGQVTTSRGGIPVAPVANPCPRFAPGSLVRNPPSLFSSNGALHVRFSYQHRFDRDGLELLCFMTPDGLQDPTLYVKPGDHLVVTVTNNTPATPVQMTLNPPNCASSQMTNSSLNIHYHGTNTSPTCHQDEVIKTLINSGETFQYNVAIPSNEPSGLYWYHPHVHMLAEHALQGGASGAIVVEGIENAQPTVSGMKQRILMVRDQPVPGSPDPNGNIPAWDVSLNYIPIPSPSSPDSGNFVPATLRIEHGEKQFWRVTNACSDTILDLQYVFDGVPQTLQLVAVDGVPLNSQDGTGEGRLAHAKHFLMPPASRVEFIVSAPPSSVRLAQLVTLGINTGPDGDNDPQRPLATIELTGDNHGDGGNDGAVNQFRATTAAQQRFAGLASAPIAVKRTVFFNEIQPTTFFMDVEGKPEHIFDPNAPPDIVATQGTVEEWTVENRTHENHEFHFHQLHFLVDSQNNFELNGSQQAPAITGQYLDMIQVPFWDGNTKHPYPNVKLRIDFRGNDLGDFVFHCHILGHEDLGMMNIIRVQASSAANSGSSNKPDKSTRAITPVAANGKVAEPIR